MDVPSTCAMRRGAVDRCATRDARGTGGSAQRSVLAQSSGCSTAVPLPVRASRGGATGTASLSAWHTMGQLRNGSTSGTVPSPSPRDTALRSESDRSRARRRADDHRLGADEGGNDLRKSV
eukprot:4362530-Prymnesium_polylepis.2